MEQSDQQEDNGKIGAVLVVGGGVGGMQAALDLANSGFKVYLTEEGTAIGGRMAQLDKTFPTNDCSMCIISPKLVETGRHLNIELMTDTEVAKVEGDAGNFTVTLRHKPRYIDVTKCTGCSECAQVCPVIIPGRFDEGMAKQRAAYKLYPQAVPNAYAIEKKGVAPCRDACPSGQRAQGYIALIRENRYEDALRVIKEDNPFPGICGRICNHRCENACNRLLLDQALEEDEYGYELISATDGFEAGLQVSHFKPDLIILDIMMPDINGYEVCRKIKSNPATKDTWIIVLSAYLNEEAFEQMKTYGADACFSKPLPLVQLKHEVAKLLGLEK